MERIIETAEIASEGDVLKLPVLIERLRDEESCVRYWAATGCVILKEKAKPASTQLRQSLDDPSADVRIAAAEALCNMGQVKKALPVIVRKVGSENSKVALHALNVLEILGEKARPALKVLTSLSKNSNDSYIIRAANHTLRKFKNG